MTSEPKLTASGKELLRLLLDGERMDITDERVVLGLERRGFAERIANTYGCWRITPAGRSALKAMESDNG